MTPIDEHHKRSLSSAHSQEYHHQSQEHSVAQTDSKEEIIDSDKSKDSQVPGERSTYNHSSDYSVQDQQPTHQGQCQLDYLESTGLESSSLSCPESLDAMEPPYFSSFKDISSYNDGRCGLVATSDLKSSIHPSSSFSPLSSPDISPPLRSRSDSQTCSLQLLGTSPLICSSSCHPSSLTPTSPVNLVSLPRFLPLCHSIGANKSLDPITSDGAATSSPLCSYTPTIAPPNSDTTSHPSILSTPVTNIEVSSKDVISAKLDPSTVTVSRFPQQSEQQPSPLPEPLSYPALSFSPDSRPHQETELDSYSSSSFVDRCSGHTNFSQSVPTDLVTLQSNDPSHKDSPCTTVPPSIPPASSSHPTPIESTVTITTSEVGSSDISQKEFYLSREIEYQSRSRAQNVRPSISGTVVQPLSPDSQKEGLSIPSNTKTQVLSSLDYLEYLEFCLASEQEQKALKRSQRPKSWIAVENFVSQRILGLGKNKSQRDLQRYHSAQLIDRSQRSSSFSLLRSEPISPPTRSSSSAPSASAIPSSLGLQQHTCAHTTQNSDRRTTSRREICSCNGGRSVDNRSTCTYSRDWSDLSPLTNIRVTFPRATSGSPLLVSSSLFSSVTPRSSRKPHTAFLGSRPHSLHSGSLVRSISPATRCNSVTSFNSSISTLSTSTSSTSTLSPSLNNTRIMSYTRSSPSSTSMSSHMSPSLSSLASDSTTSSSSSINGQYNTPSCTQLPRNSSRRPLASQHPLANVSTFDSDRDSIATDILEGAEIFSNTTQAQLHSSKDSLGDRASISSCRSSIPTTGLPRPLDSKQNDLSALKSAIRSGSSQVYVISTKPESSSSTNIPQQADSHDGLASMETEWNGFTVGSGVDQPISPLTVLSPNIPSYSLMTSEQPSERQSSPPSNTSSTAPAVPSPRQESEKWAPPPRSSRRLQESSRQESTLPPPHSRLPIPKLLKQRSFNFSFTSPSTGASSMQSTMRASMDESSSPTEHGSTSQLTRTTASCDIPRPIGPPDPIPPHYQHLQNRSSRITSFRRRSHGGELDRFPAGWTVSENAASVQATPSASASDVQFPDASRPNIPRRHASLGTHSNSTSMWGRLLTSIFPSSGSENGERDIPRRSSDGGIPDLYSQPQLLLLSSSGQQGQGPQQLSQQQLFFYADEVVDRLERSDSDYSCLQDDEAFGPRYSSEDSSGEDAPSFFQGSLTADANLQGELAQEDRRESVELMTGDTMFVRPDAPSQLIGDGFIVPRALSVDGKIPTSCLALSSPPSYWEAAVKYNGWPKIDARPEQGQESLPRYTCSVFREGCVNRKTELVGEWRPYRRPWKRTFAHLRGTSLRLYAVDAEDVPRLHVRNISLQLAKCEMATDYKQRPNVIRIRASDRTVLVECKDRIDALTWLEHLQAAANIATSLEERAMPKFHTLPRAPNHPSSGSGSRTNSNSSSSVSNRQQSSNASLQHQEEGQNSEQQRQEQQLQIQQQQQQQQQIEQQQLRQRQVERQQQQQQYLQQLQAQQEQERQYLQQQEEERQELQRQQRQRQMSMERAPRPQINERQMSMERTPRPSQRLRQPSIDQTPPQANLNPFQQLQQVLQSQQEHILKIQCRVQRQQRAQQLVVQSNESSSVLPPTLGDHSEAALSSSPPSSTSSSSSRRSDGRSAFGRLQNQSRSKSRSPPQSPPLSPPASQRARTSLMTRAERERVMTEGDRRRETAMAGEFEMMRTVLHELGHSSDSDSSINDSDEAGEDDDVMGINGPSSNRRRRTTTSASFNGHSSSAARANSQHSRVQSNQEDGGARSAANRESSGGQDWERTRFACAQQQQQLQLLQEYHEQQQLQQQQQQQQRRQRASWNKRFFSNLWGQNDHSSGHGHGQIAHPSLSLATST